MDARLQESFREFVIARWPTHVRTARLLAGDSARGEDLLQAALIKVWLAWPRVSVGRPDAFTRVVMANLATSWRRRKWSQEISVGALPETAYDDRTSRHADLDDLTRALRQLPPRQRTVVVLRYCEDMSEREVADALGCSLGTVKSHASRGLATLRVALATRESEASARSATATGEARTDGRL